jgi:replicative DNA helicase
MSHFDDDPLDEQPGPPSGEVPSRAVLDAEDAVVGAALHGRNYTETAAEILTPEHFYQATCSTAFAAALELAGGNQWIDVRSIVRQVQKTDGMRVFGNSPDRVYDLANRAAIGLEAVRNHAQLVVDDYARRAVWRACIRGVQLTSSPAFDAATDTEIVLAGVQAAAVGRPDSQPLLLADDFEDYLASLEKPDLNPVLPTPWMDVNERVRIRGGQLVVIGARPGGGKSLALDTPLPTPSGWTTMGDIRVGEQLIGADGKPCTVTAATDVMHGRPCFEVEFSDGTVIVADAEHQWLTDTCASLRSAQQAAAGRNRYRNQRTFPAVRTTAEIAATVRATTADQRANHSIVNARPFELPEADLLIAPYTLGAWLGDGGSLTPNITTVDPEILDRIRLDGYEITPRKNYLLYGISNQSEWRQRVTDGAELVRDGMPIMRAAVHVGVAADAIRKVTGPNLTGWKRGYVPTTAPQAEKHRTLTELLRDIGVLGNKHIPAAYLRASERQRRKLLAGLLDTDGTVNTSGSVQFAVTSRALAEGAYELIASLGYRPAIRTKPVKGRHPETSTCYIVTFTTTDKVVYLTRKAQRLVTTNRAGVDRRYVVDVRPIPSVPVRCVRVDNESHLFLASRACIPTHNSLAGLGIAVHTAVKRGQPAVLFSLEMPRFQIDDRILASQASVSLTAFEDRNFTDRDFMLISGVSSSVRDAPLVIDDSTSLTVSHVRTRLRWMQGQGIPAAVAVIDYIQQMKPTGRHENRVAAVGELSRELKKLAMEFNIPVIALTQLNRASEGRADKKPAMSDLRESGSIENDADIVLLLHRPPPLTDDERARGDRDRTDEVDVLVEKQRQGKNKIEIPLVWQGHYARLSNFGREYT